MVSKLESGLKQIIGGRQIESVTLRMRALVLLSKKSMFVSYISEMLTSISQINAPIPGMFGLF